MHFSSLLGLYGLLSVSCLVRGKADLMNARQNAVEDYKNEDPVLAEKYFSERTTATW